jgi:hypothetical protein
MQTYTLTGKVDADGRLRLDVSTQLPPGEFEVVVHIGDVPSGQTHRRYDFSDLAGKLSWRGDAVAEQRRLRDE